MRRPRAVLDVSVIVLLGLSIDGGVATAPLTLELPEHAAADVASTGALRYRDDALGELRPLGVD